VRDLNVGANLLGGRIASVENRTARVEATLASATVNLTGAVAAARSLTEVVNMLYVVLEPLAVAHGAHGSCQCPPQGNSEEASPLFASVA
jgi:hypothetical protein